MKKISKILILIISLAMIIVYFVPVWEITLDAPQYPEGLELYIWINNINGDLSTINSLNHYIGMKMIEPDSITELKIMPYLLGFLIVTGILISVLNKRNLFFFWVIVFIIMGIAGGIDFYLWEYDYGHNLSPNAIIKVPGMSYQPPLIGSKDLLNFNANSWPALGGIVLIGSGIVSVLLMFYELKYNKKKTDEKTT
jgi:hypothetical protein